MAIANVELDTYGITSQWRKSTPARRTLLVVYAHPDDESFGNGGTIARYSAEGVAVHYACATRGECGTVTSAHLEGFADIAALRTAELSCAADALDLAAVHYLGYRDSGMAGTAFNDHPEALARAPVERVTGQVVALIRTLQPQVVLTFGPYGGYGHPDHIAIHYATLAAFSVAGNAAYYPEQLASGLQTWSPTKLYYPTFGTTVPRLGLVVMRLLRKDPRRFGANQDMDFLRATVEATPVTTAVATSSYLDAVDAAWRCHRSQLGDMARMMRIPRAIRRRISTELFTRIVPAWDGPSPRERDLFAGIE